MTMAEPISVQAGDAPGKGRPFRRQVFYIPGYDPIHPRRYRELYRKEGAAQAALSGYALSLSPKKTGATYGWHVQGQIDGARAEVDFEVLVWSDIVRGSKLRGFWPPTCNSPAPPGSTSALARCSG